jgi:hypothetical protein
MVHQQLQRLLMQHFANHGWQNRTCKTGQSAWPRRLASPTDNHCANTKQGLVHDAQHDSKLAKYNLLHTSSHWPCARQWAIACLAQLRHRRAAAALQGATTNQVQLRHRHCRSFLPQQTSQPASRCRLNRRLRFEAPEQRLAEHVEVEMVGQPTPLSVAASVGLQTAHDKHQRKWHL